MQTTRDHDFWNQWSEIVVLSAHSDDAAFSLVGTLHEFARRHTKINLITCFSLSQFTRNCGSNELEAVSRTRKEEDKSFVNMLGGACTPIWLDLADAPLRSPCVQAVFAARGLSEEERRLASHVASRVSTFLSPTSALFVPMGIGGHIDHRIVLESVRSLFCRNWPSVLFYEDMPYAAYIPDAHIVKAAVTLAQDFQVAVSWRALWLPNMLELKRQAAAYYKSQVLSSDLKLIDTLSERFGNERIWVAESDRVQDLPTGSARTARH